MNNAADHIVDCIISLEKAIQNTGGTIKSLDQLAEMTAYDLIKCIAPNGIRFVFDSSKILK